MPIAAQKKIHVLLISFLLFGMYALLAARLVNVQMTVSDEYEDRQDVLRARSPHRIGSAGFERAARGGIYDSRGRPLAVSYDTFRLVVDPSRPHAELTLDERAAALVEVLMDLGIDDFDANDVFERITTTHWEKKVDGKRRRIRRRVVLDGILPDQRAYIREVMAGARIRNFSFEAVQRRAYPEGALTAQIVGYVGQSDEDESEGDRGRAGIEMYLDDVLAGENGRFLCEKDGRQRELDVAGSWDREPVDGSDIGLTIDVRIQAIVSAALKRTMVANTCDSVTAVVIETQTGRVLAMQTAPECSQEDIRNKRARPDQLRCRAVEDSYEPGSTFKAFVVAKALEWGYVDWNDTFDTNHGHYVFHARPGDRGRGLKDSSAHGIMTVREIITLSSNIGMARIGFEKLGIERLYDAIETFGFDEPPRLCLPGKARGRFTKRSLARKKPLSAGVSIPFGHEIAMSPLTLASKYGVFGTGGVWHAPSVVAWIGRDDDRVVPDAVSKRYLSEEAANSVKQVLGEVVTEGTARHLRKMKWSSLAKTGTAQIMGPGGFQGAYNSSLIAMAPFDRPRITVLVVLNRVRGKRYYGDTVAGPAVREIIEATLATLGVPPDRKGDAR